MLTSWSPLEYSSETAGLRHWTWNNMCLKNTRRKESCREHEKSPSSIPEGEEKPSKSQVLCFLGYMSPWGEDYGIPSKIFNSRQGSSLICLQTWHGSNVTFELCLWAITIMRINGWRARNTFLSREQAKKICDSAGTSLARNIVNTTTLETSGPVFGDQSPVSICVTFRMSVGKIHLL